MKRNADETLHCEKRVDGTVHDEIEPIAAASDRRSSAVARIITGLEQISAIIQTNSATTEESAAASEAPSGRAQMLHDLIGMFRLSEIGQRHRRLFG